MDNLNTSREICNQPQTLSNDSGAEAITRISKEANVLTAGRTAIKISIFTAEVVGTPSLTLQQSNGLGFWTDTTATEALAANPGNEVTVDVPNNNLVDVDATLLDGQLITIQATVLPGGIEPNKMYKLKEVSANTFKVLSTDSGEAIKMTSTGTAPVAHLVTETILKLIDTVTADQVDLPLASNARIVATLADGETVQVVSIKAVGAY